ncbi:MAG: M20/M25/M40 family metallo-hydrolase [Actinobacteria bacterium]|nr:M20/M25/M40 family metallo-hydrolase [Actinomycetota bacterium]
MASVREATGSAVVDLLADLVAFPTESLSTNLELIDLFADRAARADAAVDVVHGDTGRANLHVRFGPDVPGGILLSGHTDVVPAGTGWATDPYSLTEVDGQLRARGSADMKGFLAAALVVLESVDLATLRAPVHLGLSYDEEIGCVGVHGLLDRLAGHSPCAPEVVVVGEPTGMRLCNAHTGKVAHRIDVRARAGHSSRAAIDPSAVMIAAGLAVSIGDLNSTSAGISANVGSIHGGLALNVLAPDCTLDFELRHGADTDPEAVLAGFWQEVASARSRLEDVGGHIEAEQVLSYPALATDPSLDAVTSLEALVGSGRPLPVSFGCEAGLYADRLGTPAVIVGPGDIADAHKPNEYVEPAQLDRCVEVLHETIQAFCTGADPEESP